MSYQNQVDVICLGDPKQSALYFDSVIPISYIFDLFCRKEIYELYYKVTGKNTEDINVQEIILKYVNKDLEIINSLVADDVYTERQLMGHVRLFFDLFKWIFEFALYCVRIPKEDDLYTILAETAGGTIPISVHKAANAVHENMLSYEKLNGRFSIDTPEELSVFLRVLYRNIQNLFCLFYIENFPKFTNLKMSIREYLSSIPEIKKGHRSLALPSSCFKFLNGEPKDITISLSGIDLIDTQATEWDKIIEFRKDSNAKKKLRNLRLFLNSTYSGKSLAYMEDDLHRRLEDYYDTCKEWGFETTTSVLSSVMDSKSLRATIGTTLASLVLGEPIITAGIGVSGSLLELGKVTMGFVKSKHSFQKLKKDHDLAYIIEAKDKLEKS